MPQRRLQLRSESPITMEDVKSIRDELLQTSNDLLCMVDEENCMELKRAGKNIYLVTAEILDCLSEEPDAGEDLAKDFQLLAEKYGFERKGGIK